MRSAARMGLPTLSSFFVPIAELQRRRDVYREEALAAGHSLAEIERLEALAWGMRVVHIAESRQEALRVTEGPFMGYQHKMAVLRTASTGGSVPNSFDRTYVRLRPFHDYMQDGLAHFGTPDEVREGLGATWRPPATGASCCSWRCPASRPRPPCARCACSSTRWRRR